MVRTIGSRVVDDFSRSFSFTNEVSPIICFQSACCVSSCYQDSNIVPIRKAHSPFEYLNLLAMIVMLKTFQEVACFAHLSLCWFASKYHWFGYSFSQMLHPDQLPLLLYQFKNICNLSNICEISEALSVLMGQHTITPLSLSLIHTHSLSLYIYIA